MDMSGRWINDTNEVRKLALAALARGPGQPTPAEITAMINHPCGAPPLIEVEVGEVREALDTAARWGEVRKVKRREVGPDGLKMTAPRYYTEATWAYAAHQRVPAYWQRVDAVRAELEKRGIAYDGKVGRCPAHFHVSLHGLETLLGLGAGS
jgi:hypothetical protein